MFQPYKISFMNHIFKITSIAGLCFLFNSISAQNKNKSATRIIEIQNGDTVRNETIVIDSEPDNDPDKQSEKQNYSYKFEFNEKELEKNIEDAFRNMERGLKNMDDFTMNIDISDMEKGMERMMQEVEKLSDIKIDTRTKKRWGKKQTEITIRGPRGNNQVIIFDKKGNIKTKKEFDKKQAKKYEEDQKKREAEQKIKELEEKERRKYESEHAAPKHSAIRSPKFMMSTEDNKVYNFEIETDSDKEVEIEITGKDDKVLLKEIEPRGRKFEKEVDLGKFGPGTYNIKMSQDGKEISKHTIVIEE